MFLDCRQQKLTPTNSRRGNWKGTRSSENCWEPWVWTSRERNQGNPGGQENRIYRKSLVGDKSGQNATTTSNNENTFPSFDSSRTKHLICWAWVLSLLPGHTEEEGGKVDSFASTVENGHLTCRDVQRTHNGRNSFPPKNHEAAQKWY